MQYTGLRPQCAVLVVEVVLLVPWLSEEAATITPITTAVVVPTMICVVVEPAATLAALVLEPAATPLSGGSSA